MIRKSYYSNNLKNWFTDLKKDNIVQTINENGKEIYCFTTPFLIRIRKSVITKLKKEYDPKVEKGGILLGKPLRENMKKVLEICEVVFVKNISENTYHSYRPSRNDFEETLSYSFHRGNRKLIYYPIFFHTHPTFDYREPYQLMKYFLQVGTSEADQKSSRMVITIGSINIALPDALIVSNQEFGGQFFIGFYGGHIAPEDFSEYMIELTGKSIAEVLEILRNWADTPTKKFLLIIIGITLGAVSIYYIRHTIPILIIMLSTNVIPLSQSSIEETPKYFAQVKNDEVMIQIPEYCIG